MTFTIWTIDVKNYRLIRLAHDSKGQLFIYAFEIQNLEIGKKVQYDQLVQIIVD